jgi:hypothetical protein
MKMIDNFLELLRAKHGKDLDLEKDVYFLFLKGGLFSIYYDPDEDKVQMTIEMLPYDHTYVYYSDMDLVTLGVEEGQK